MADNYIYCNITSIFARDKCSGEARGFAVGGGIVARVWRRSPQRGPVAEPLVRGSGAKPLLKLKSFQPSEDRGTWQICHSVKYSVNCSNILLVKVFVSPLP